MKEFQMALQDVLFLVGAVPIDIFLIGQFGNFLNGAIRPIR